jgi:ATP-binding cassette, subfamily B, heavy metal transporter
MGEEEKKKGKVNDSFEGKEKNNIKQKNMNKLDDEEKINFKYNLKIYLSLLKKYKGLIAVLMVLIIIFELSMIADRLILKKVIDQATLFSSHSITLEVFGTFIALMAILYVVIIIVRAITNWFKLHLINRLEGKAILGMKKRFFNHIVDLSHGFHTSNKTGSLISRFVRGGSAVERMTDTLVFDMIPLVIQVIAVVIAVLVFDWVTSVMILVIVAVFLAFSLMINKSLRKSNVIANEREDDEKAYISDVFINIDSIKYFGKENAIKSKYNEKGKVTKDSLMKNWDYYRWLTAGQTFIIGVGIVALLALPFTRFMRGEITLGEIVFIYTIYGNITSPLYRFVGGIRSYYRAMADFDALFKYELSHNDIIDAPDAKDLVVNKGNIEFKKVSFSYKERKIISDLNMKVAAGKRVALVGSSGAGKSTVVKLLYRLYDVQEGEILIDGENINKFKQESLRSELSIVPQDCVLFDDTIYNNIAFSRPDATRDGL